MIDAQLPPINLHVLRPAYMMTTSILTETNPDQKNQQFLDERVNQPDVCKGAWELGTACGKCPRCVATKPKTPLNG